MTRSLPAAPAAAVPAKRRRLRWKPLLIWLAVLGVIVGGLGATYTWTQTQFFVGADGHGSEVAIFRGVNTEFGPLKFFTVYKNTNLEIAELNPSVRSQVRSGITASSASDAERIVTNLRDNRLPLCATQTPTPVPSPTPTPARPSTGALPTATPSVATTTAASTAATTSRVNCR